MMKTAAPKFITDPKEELSIADNLKVEVNRLIRKPQFQLTVQVMNVLMTGVAVTCGGFSSCLFVGDCSGTGYEGPTCES